MNLGKSLGSEYIDTITYATKIATGHALEFGVASGRTLRLIAESMPVTGFDSFEGLPEDWRDGFPKGAFSCNVPSVPDAEIVVGLFEQTLPVWIDNNTEILSELGLVHIDCDLYSSTKTIFKHLEEFIVPGVIIVFDEYHGYPGFENHEFKAWSEFIKSSGKRFDILGHGPEQLAVRITE